MSCPLPPVTPGVEVITIGEGVIAYQCEEGLVPVGMVEAMCGDDGRWSPDSTQHMCISMTTTTSTDSTSATNTQETEKSTNIIDTQNGVSISITVGVSVAVALVFSMGAFILGMIAGIYRTKSRQATPTQSPPVPTSHSQNRTSPGGVPVYEEIVLDEKDIPLTGNTAYGYTH